MYKIPTYNYTTEQWDYTEFNSREEFASFVGSLIKEPGEYNFDSKVKKWQEEGNRYMEKGYYCDSVELSKDYKDYWLTQKERCTKGVIYKDEKTSHYLPRDYYMWINFLPIFDKVKKKYSFPTIWDTQYHVTLIEYHAELTYKHIIQLKKRQFGMEQPHSSLIQTPNGPITMGDIKEGDHIWNPDGSIQEVIGKFPQGKKQVYELTFETGDIVKCGLNHLWQVYDEKTQFQSILSVKELIKKGLSYNEISRFSVDLTSPIEYPKKDLKIKPYVIGVTVTNITLTNNQWNDYTYTSVDDRISFVQGLMDSKGNIDQDGENIYFTTTNESLIKRVSLICKSLGLKVELTSEQGVYKLYFHGNIWFTPFTVAGKVKKFNNRSKYDQNRNSIISIKKLDYKEEQSCIAVSNPNHLYLSNNYVITHNTLYHMSKLINSIWFDEGVTLKLLGYLETYINQKGAWNILESYRNFLNAHTGWYRNFTPDKTLNWEQKVEVQVDGRKQYKGLMGKLLGITTQLSPTSGVGGNTTYCVAEESGINPNLNITYEYMRPALQSGLITTGQFIAYGSVGDLDQCEPLKDYILNPDVNGFYSIETKYFDNKGTIKKVGMFIPEQWSMPPYIDEHGNSQVEEALEAIFKIREEWKKSLDPDTYQVRISQHPTNLLEAFNTRSVSIFPAKLTSHQTRRIEEGEYFCENLNLVRDLKTGDIKALPSTREPIKEWPVKKNTSDKRGCLQVWERPDKNPEWGMYYASIDPVGTGATSTSESLCSIIVWKNEIEVTKQNEVGEWITFIEEGRMVAEWTGRFDDINETHEFLRIIIEWYNAWTIIEANVPQFITHMTNKKKLHYLVPSDQIIFTREISSKAKPNYPYGWKNTGRFFTDTILPFLLELIGEQTGIRTNPETGAEIPIYGIEKIPSLMVMKEMEGYEPGKNVDRLIALAALAAFIIVQKANRGRIRKQYDANQNLDNSGKNSILNMRNSVFKRNNTIKKQFFRTLK